MEEELAAMLKQQFDEEKDLLASIKRKEQKREANLKVRIASLDRITRIYDEKKERLNEIKKRKAALKRELTRLAKQKEIWGAYA